MDFFRYWQRIGKRAFSDTLAFFPFRQRPKTAAASSAIFVVATGFLYLVAGVAPVLENLNNAFALGLAAVVVFTTYYAINFISAPHRIDREKENARASLERRLNNREMSRTLAQPLRDKISHVDEIIEREREDVFDNWNKSTAAQEWEVSVIKIMRNGGLPEDEIHMFETISHIPSLNFLAVGHDENKTVNEAVSAKKNKLRQIVARLLRDEDNGAT